MGYQRSQHPHKLERRCLSGNVSEAQYFPSTMQSEHSKFDIHSHPRIFQSWMQSVHSGADVGAFSHRFWCTERTSYSSDIPGWDDGQLGECVRDLPPQSSVSLQTGLADQDNLFSNVNCWVEMSNLNADLAFCLREFERSHPGSIDLGFVAEFEARPRHK